MTASLSTALPPSNSPATTFKRSPRSNLRSFYPAWFFVPAIALYVVFFAVPTFASFYFSLTRWTLFDHPFVGLENFKAFFANPQTLTGFAHTFEYGIGTSLAKVVIGLALALLLTSPILGRGYLRAVVFFPVLVSTIGVGITFKALLDPYHGAVNAVFSTLGLGRPGWLTDPALALWSVAAVDVWKGVGVATLIFIAGIVAIPQEYFEAARVDGASSWKIFRSITLPLSRPAMGSVVILSLIGGLRSFDLIWAMTGGGPGYTSDVIASVIYKQYQAGFFGLSTAGNVILFIVVAVIMIPISRIVNRKGADL